MTVPPGYPEVNPSPSTVTMSANNWGAFVLLYSSDTGQYIFYYVDDKNKQWAVFIKKLGNTEYYELRTAYRVDCGPPYRCTEDGKGYSSIIDKWKCEGFKLISPW